MRSRKNSVIALFFSLILLLISKNQVLAQPTYTCAWDDTAGCYAKSILESECPNTTNQLPLNGCLGFTNESDCLQTHQCEYKNNTYGCTYLFGADDDCVPYVNCDPGCSGGVDTCPTDATACFNYSPQTCFCPTPTPSPDDPFDCAAMWNPGIDACVLDPNNTCGDIYNVDFQLSGSDPGSCSCVCVFDDANSCSAIWNPGIKMCLIDPRDICGDGYYYDIEGKAPDECTCTCAQGVPGCTMFDPAKIFSECPTDYPHHCPSTAYCCEELHLCDDVTAGVDRINVVDTDIYCAHSLFGLGIRTAMGCIPVHVRHATGWFLQIGIPLGGVSSFIVALYAGLLLVTSSGNPDKIQKARQTLTAALSGLVLIILSIFILRVANVNLFGLPGF